MTGAGVVDHAFVLGDAGVGEVDGFQGLLEAAKVALFRVGGRSDFIFLLIKIIVLSLIHLHHNPHVLFIGITFPE